MAMIVQRLRPAFFARIRLCAASISAPSVGSSRSSGWALAPAESRGIDSGMTFFARFYAKKAATKKVSRGAKAAKAAKAAKEKAKKEAVTKQSKGKKAPPASKSTAGGGESASGMVEVDRWTPREPEELIEDELFTGARGLKELTAMDINKYFYLSEDDTRTYFAEGLPASLIKEFQCTGGSFVRMRPQVVKFFQRLRAGAKLTYNFTPSLPEPVDAGDDAEGNAGEDTVVNAGEDATGEDPVADAEMPDAETKVKGSRRKHCAKIPELPFTDKTSRVLRRHYILDGYIGCGKTFALATIVHWARAEGWLVFYVPNAKSWTRNGYYYLNELTGYWDTPLQAQKVLQAFLDSHADMLEKVTCKVPDPIFLGEAAGLGRQPGPQEITMPEGSTLKDLVEKGITLQTAASNIVVRLRQELDLVKEFPVLIAVDEYNSWFNLSEYYQFLDFRKRRNIHSRELAMVNAFRKMADSPTYFIGAFSKSTNVGKLPLELPGAPKDLRVNIDRMSKEEVRATMDYYHRQKVVHYQPSEQTVERLFYLTNGNGMEIRKLARIM